MKKKIVKLVKGESLIYVTVGDAGGGNGYAVSLGGNCSIHYHEKKDSAMAEFCLRIGRLVSDGYTAELYDEDKR